MGAVRMRVQTADTKFRTVLLVNSARFVHISLLIGTTQLFNWNKNWITERKLVYFSQKHDEWWICLLKTQLFALQDVNWWTRVTLISCGLMWCFYQQFGFSFWRHPFTAEDHWWESNDPFLQICSNEETNSFKSWVAWRWVNFLGKLFL